VLEDPDPGETQEWVDALVSVLAYEGAERAFHLLDEVVAEARREGAPVPCSATTPYLDTIPPGKEEWHPGDRAIGAAGVIVDDRGFIPVDEQMRTDVGHVSRHRPAGGPSRSGGTRA
jgi:hypothetical protein